MTAATPSAARGTAAARALAELLATREGCRCDIRPDSTYEELVAMQGCTPRYVCPVLDKARRILERVR